MFHFLHKKKNGTIPHLSHREVLSVFLLTQKSTSKRTRSAAVLRAYNRNCFGNVMDFTCANKQRKTKLTCHRESRWNFSVDVGLAKMRCKKIGFNTLQPHILDQSSFINLNNIPHLKTPCHIVDISEVNYNHFFNMRMAGNLPNELYVYPTKTWLPKVLAFLEGLTLSRCFGCSFPTAGITV